jgi:tRNA C32,U32 (ribose-2'-O)-methylase TrmJ
MPDDVLSRVQVVLHEPQDPVNIAAAVRAMKNMGVTRLRLGSRITTRWMRLSPTACAWPASRPDIEPPSES